MRGQYQILVASRYPLSGQALFAFISNNESKSRVVFRKCLSREPMPEGFDPQIVLINCVDSCPGVVPYFRRAYPDAKCIAIARSPAIHTQLSWIRQGIHGVIDESEEVSLKTFNKVVECVLRGELWVSREVLYELCREQVLPKHNTGRKGLTAREEEILSWLQRGLKNSDIASHLQVSEKTVKGHLTNIYGKLGAESRTQAILKWAQICRSRPDHAPI